MSTQTINHGLGVAPEMIIAKERDSGSGTGDWAVWHKDLSSGTYLVLNDSAGEASWTDDLFSNIGTTSVDFGNDPDDSGIYLNGGDVPNNYIAYFFASVEGYSKVGKYVGSGVSGNFIYTGFRPQFLIYKHNASGHGWHMLDDKREPYNPLDTMQQGSEALADAASPDFDFLSNGFRIFDTTGPYNETDEDYIYYAVGQSLKYASAR